MQLFSKRNVMGKIKLTLIIIVCVFISLSTNAQQKSNDYYKALFRADSTYQAGNKELSLAMFNELEKKEGKDALSLWGKALIYGEEQNKDSVIFLLREAVYAYGWENYDWIRRVPHFSFLEDDSDFVALVANMKKDHEMRLKKEGKNAEVAMLLMEASIKDQLVRQRLDVPGLSENERKELTRRGIQLDEENQALLLQILNEHGLPTEDWVGKKAAQAAFLIILHADNNPELQQTGLKLMEKAVKENKISEGYYVKLKKRISF